MKKTMKKIIVTVVVMFALIGAGGVTAFASGYINWNGTQAYQSILVTLEQIKTKGQGLKAERDESNRSNEQLVNQIRDKDNLINSKDQEIEAKQKEIDNLEASNSTSNGKLEQAETDMKDVDQKSKDVLNSLN